MAQVKVANWNIEWMNKWFTGDKAGPPALKRSDQVSGVSDINGLVTRVAAVIEAIDADILTIQEGPSRLEEMELFVRDFLGDAYVVVGPVGRGQQKLFTLARRGSAAIVDIRRIEAEFDIDFDDRWEVDIDADLELDDYRFTRPPLVTRVTSTSGRSFRLLNVHAKSKFVHRGEQMWRDPERRPEFIRRAIEARRRISAEALRTRAYLDACFADDIEAAIMVAGDFNDGPGLDFFERYFLTHNVAGMVAGNPFQPRRMLRHVFIDVVDAEDNYTAIFDDFVDEIPKRRILLDHIFTSASLFWNGDGRRNAIGRIEHEVFDQHVDANAPTSSRQHAPSDHRPQSVTLDV